MIKLLPYILFEKYIYILAQKMASPGNQHCARCMDTVVNLLLPAHRRHYAMLRCVRPSVRLSVPYPWFKDDAFHGYDYYRTLATGSRTHWAAWPLGVTEAGVGISLRRHRDDTLLNFTLFHSFGASSILHCVPINVCF